MDLCLLQGHSTIRTVLWYGMVQFHTIPKPLIKHKSKSYHLLPNKNKRLKHQQQPKMANTNIQGEDLIRHCGLNDKGEAVEQMDPQSFHRLLGKLPVAVFRLYGRSNEVPFHTIFSTIHFAFLHKPSS